MLGLMVIHVSKKGPWWCYWWVMSTWLITCTARHPHLYTCRISFVWHQSFLVKSLGQTSWHTHKHTNQRKGWKHYYLAIAGDKFDKVLWWHMLLLGHTIQSAWYGQADGFHFTLNSIFHLRNICIPWKWHQAWISYMEGCVWKLCMIKLEPVFLYAQLHWANIVADSIW